MIHRFAVFMTAALALAACEQSGGFDVTKADRSVVRPIAICMQNGSIRGNSTGTGFVIAPGYVATNDHVVRLPGNCTRRVVVPEGTWKNLLKARVVWQSRELDLAIIHVPQLDRPTVTLSDLGSASSPGKGERVAAIGFPTVSDKMLQAKTTGNRAHLVSTYTQGSVSKVVIGTVPNTGSIERPMIQHTAPINKGNSGGPLFNTCNEVVGVNTYGAFIRIQGEKRFGGTPVPGVYYAPHISNLIKSLRTVPQLKSIAFKTSSKRCRVSQGGVPIFLYGGGGLLAVLVLLSLILALRKGTTREVVRVVESYSAWVRRKDVDTGTPRTPSVRTKQRAQQHPQPDVQTQPTRDRAKRESAEPAGVGGRGGYVLSGFDGAGNAVRLSIAIDEVETASQSAERGVIIGRSQSLSDKILTDGSVSRRHARISFFDGVLQVEDLNSSYGTEINGQVLAAFQPTPLAVGASIKLGEVKLDVSQA